MQLFCVSAAPGRGRLLLGLLFLFGRAAQGLLWGMLGVVGVGRDTADEGRPARVERGGSVSVGGAGIGGILGRSDRPDRLDRKRRWSASLVWWVCWFPFDIAAVRGASGGDDAALLL